MTEINALPEKQRRGSFPRCVRFMSSARTVVADRLKDLVDLREFDVKPEDIWMPAPILGANGEYATESISEAVLLDSAGPSNGLLKSGERDQLTEWWLAYPENANSPNWDIASTCKVEGRPGLLLVEAKAHANELKSDGKSLDENASHRSEANHKRIGDAIRTASVGLSGSGLGWNLSCNSHYQLSNRFA